MHTQSSFIMDPLLSLSGFAAFMVEIYYPEDHMASLHIWRLKSTPLLNTFQAATLFTNSVVHPNLILTAPSQICREWAVK